MSAGSTVEGRAGSWQRPDDPSRRSALLVVRYAGAAAVAILWGTVGIGMHRSGLSLGDSRPISYLGTDPRTVLLFQVGLISSAALLSAFAWALGSRQSRSSGFVTVFLTGMACQVIVALVPISGRGLSHDIHLTAGIMLGLSLPILMWRFAAAQVPGRWRRQCYGLMWLEVAACFGGVTLSRAGRASLAEALPACLFHLWVIVVTIRWRSLERIT